jgi:hypothetical protein
MDDATGESLGSLAQSARNKELKTARGILFAIGVLTIAVGGIAASMARSLVDKEIENALADLRAQGMVADEAAVEEARTAGVRTLVTANLVAVALGVLFIIFGIFVYQKPVPITIAALVIYIGSAAAFGALDPSTLGKGLIIKILIVVALFKAVQAAIASEKEKADGVMSPVA